MLFLEKQIDSINEFCRLNFNVENNVQFPNDCLGNGILSSFADKKTRDLLSEFEQEIIVIRSVKAGIKTFEVAWRRIIRNISYLF